MIRIIAGDIDQNDVSIRALNPPHYRFRCSQWEARTLLHDLGNARAVDENLENCALLAIRRDYDYRELRHTYSHIVSTIAAPKQMARM